MIGMLLAGVIATQVISRIELKTIVDMEGGGLRYRSIIGRLDRTEFASMAAEFLGPREVKLGAIAVYGSLRDHVLAGPRGGDHCGYETWRALMDGHDLSHEGCPQVQQAIKIGDNIVVRSLDRDCRRSMNPLRGQTNPLDLSIGGKRFEVLEVSFSRPMGTRNARRIAAHLYVRTTGLVSKELAEAITDQVRSMTGAYYLGVSLRSDTWFLTSCNFPAFYAFEDRSKIPNKQEFYTMKHVACFVSGSWPIRCFEGAGRP